MQKVRERTLEQHYISTQLHPTKLPYLCILRCTHEVVNRMYEDLWSQNNIQLTALTEPLEKTLEQHYSVPKQ